MWKGERYGLGLLRELNVVHRDDDARPPPDENVLDMNAQYGCGRASGGQIPWLMLYVLNATAAVVDVGLALTLRNADAHRIARSRAVIDRPVPLPAAPPRLAAPTATHRLAGPTGRGPGRGVAATNRSAGPTGRGPGRHRDLRRSVSRRSTRRSTFRSRTPSSFSRPSCTTSRRRGRTRGSSSSAAASCSRPARTRSTAFSWRCRGGARGNFNRLTTPGPWQAGVAADSPWPRDGSQEKRRPVATPTRRESGGALEPVPWFAEDLGPPG